LVETGLAVGLRGDEGAVLLAGPGVLEVTAEVRHGQDLGQVQARMIEVIEGLAADGVSGQEVERAKGRRLKDVRRTVSDTSRLANALTEWIALGDWRTFFIHRDRLRAVSAADVNRVASQYLIETNRTAGMLVPAKEMLRATIPPVPDVGELVEGYHGTQATAAGEAFVATPENIDRRTLRVSLEPGMKVALLQKETRGDMVRAEFRFHFGDEQSLSAHVTALRLLPALLQRGTAKRDYQQLRDEIDRLQSEISVRGGVGTFAASIESDRAHIVPAIALLAEMLQQPAFAPAQFEIVKKERLARLEEDLSSSQERCFNALRRAVYPWPADSIHYMPTLEEKNERLKAVSLETVKDLYARFYGGGHSEVSVVGDFDRGAVLKALGTHFGTWESGYPYRRIEMPHRAIDTRHRTVDVPGAQMSVVAMGTHLEMRDDDPDYPALRFASYVLGESDKCRLYSRLRYKDAMTYHTGGYLRADSQDRRTSVFAYAFCSPTEADKVLQVMAEEVRRWIADGVTAEELAASQKSYRLECLNQLADDSFVARELIDGLELGRKMAFHDDVLSRIQALTEADIKRALNEHLGGAKFVEIKAGDFE
ncbi:MAG: insulinase family protein, partial [Phycisphaerales bacterium]